MIGIGEQGRARQSKQFLKGNVSEYINRRVSVGQIENQRHTEAELFALTHWEDISQSIEKGSHRSMRERKRGDVM